jgi:gliding motility-associated-like protein
LAPANYTVTITDANNCTHTTNAINVTQPTALAAVSNITGTIACFGNTTGQITVNASGGTLAYQYSLNGGPNQASNVFSNLGPGSYTVTVTDGNNCTVNAAQVSITQPAQLTASGSVTTPIDCNGGTATVTITASGGTGALTYTQNPGGASNGTGVFTGLTPNTYNYTVTDANNCTATVNGITVTQPTAVTGTLALVQDVLCNGANNGIVQVNGAGGGTGALSYTLNPGGTINATGVFTGLAPGNYTVTIADANNCTFTTNSVTVSEPAVLTAASNITGTIACFGNTTGQVTVTANGGVGPYQYSLNGGPSQASNVFSNLAAGSYTVTVTDANNCTAVAAQVTIGQPTQLQANGSVTTPILCFGATGTITVTANGGTAPYTYAQTGGGSNATGVFTGLAAGTYSYTVTDGNGCTVNVNGVQLSQPTQLTATLAVTDSVRCNGEANGRLTASAAGGVAPYTYSINGGTAQASPVFANMAAANYTVTVQDANGCTATASVNLVDPPALTLTVANTLNPTCNGATDGQIVVSRTGGTPGFVFAISPGGTQPTGTFTNLAGGTYTLTVTDAHGCTDSRTASLVPSAILRPRASVDVRRVCLPGIVQFDGSASTTSAGTIVSYDWNFGDGNTGTGAQTAHTYTQPGVYNVTLSIASSTGCVKDSVFTAMVTVLPDAVAAFTSTPTRDDYINTDNAEIRFQDQSQNAVRWQWDFGNGNTSNRQNPTFTLPAGVTCVRLTVYNDLTLNCPSTDTLCYNVVDEGIHVPTAFIPGSNGSNAFFHAFTHENFESFEMRLYDRWGIEIGVFDTVLPGWDGTINGTIAPEGVYTYKITFKRRGSSKPGIRTGTVTVLH